MTIVSLTAIQPKAGADWTAIQKQISAGNEIAKRHGAENVTVMATMAGGPATGGVTILTTASDWTAYGRTQDAMWADPEMQALTANPDSPIATWHTYVSQTLDI
jgi:hypothetical protein